MNNFDNYSNITALVVGAGGLGGYVIEHLARNRIGRIIVMDGDVFDESNLNRQLYAIQSTLGLNKAQVAASRIEDIGYSKPTAVAEFFGEGSKQLVNQADIVFDCLDSVSARLLLAEACAEYNKPLFHGAICGTTGQFATVLAGDDILSKVYENAPDKTTSNTYSITPAVVGAMQVAQALAFLDGATPPRAITLFDAETGSLTPLKL